MPDNPTIPARIAAARERIAAKLQQCDAATPGPWYDDFINGLYGRDGSIVAVFSRANNNSATGIDEANVQFAAAARTDHPTAMRFVLDMLDEAERDITTPEQEVEMRDFWDASEHLPLVTQHAAALRTLTRIEQLLEETK